MSDRKNHFWWERKYDWDRPTLSGQKLVAWMFAIGIRPRLPYEQSGRRPHRGELPDVDFDRAVVDPRNRPFWLRLADLLFGRPHRLPAEIEAELTASLSATVGENLASAYTGEDQTGVAEVRTSDGNNDPTRWSRAA